MPPISLSASSCFVPLLLFLRRSALLSSITSGTMIKVKRIRIVESRIVPYYIGIFTVYLRMALIFTDIPTVPGCIRCEGFRKCMKQFDIAFGSWFGKKLSA